MRNEELRGEADYLCIPSYYISKLFVPILGSQEQSSALVVNKRKNKYNYKPQ